MFKILLTLLFSFYTTISYSHSQLTDILPKSNIVYTKIPSKIELTFRSKVKLIKIDLNKTSGENSKIKIELKNYTERAKKFKLPINEFKRSSFLLSKNINTKNITSIGIVAFGRDHSADIYIKEINFID